MVFQVGLLGDTLVAMPAIRAIRDSFPDRDLVLLTSHLGRPNWISPWDVLAPTGWFSDVVFYDASRAAIPRAREAWRIVRQLRARSVEAVFNLAPPRGRWQLARDRLFFRLLVGARSYAAQDKAIALRNHYRKGIPVGPEGLRQLRIATHDADARTLDEFRLAIPEGNRATASRVLRDFGIGDRDLFVAIAPGSRMPAKQWPESRFREVGDKLLAARHRLVLLAIGGPDERARCQRLCEAWGPRSRNLAGCLEPYGSAAVLERCALYVGNDSGAMHLAAMVGTPCVAIFSAREAAGRWYPFGSTHAVLRHETACAGCMLEECVIEKNACLARISVDDVVRAAMMRLDGGAVGIRLIRVK